MDKFLHFQEKRPTIPKFNYQKLDDHFFIKFDPLDYFCLQFFSTSGLQNITKSDNTDLSAYLGRGPHKKEPAIKPVTRTPPISSVSSAPAPEPELVVTPLDNGDGFSVGNSSALLFWKSCQGKVSLCDVYSITFIYNIFLLFIYNIFLLLRSLSFLILSSQNNFFAYMLHFVQSSFLI